MKARIEEDLAAARDGVFEGCSGDDSRAPRNPFGHLRNDERHAGFARA